MLCWHRGQGTGRRRDGRPDRGRDSWKGLKRVVSGRRAHNEARKQGTCERPHLRKIILSRKELFESMEKCRISKAKGTMHVKGDLTRVVV